MKEYFYRYIIRTPKGLIHYDLPLKEYARKLREGIPIGISFSKFEWLNGFDPILFSKTNGTT